MTLLRLAVDLIGSIGDAQIATEKSLPPDSVTPSIDSHGDRATTRVNRPIIIP